MPKAERASVARYGVPCPPSSLLRLPIPTSARVGPKSEPLITAKVEPINPIIRRACLFTGQTPVIEGRPPSPRRTRRLLEGQEGTTAYSLDPSPMQSRRMVEAGTFPSTPRYRLKPETISASG